MKDLWELLWIAAVSGFIGTSGMTALLWIITKLDIVHVDMVRAVGSLFTKSMDSAIGVGLVAHYATGIILAFFYVLIISIIDINDVFQATVIGSTIGFIHGFVVSFLLVVAVGEHHPLEQFRQPGLTVAIGHYAGHLVYGFLVGLVAGIMMT